MKIYVRSANNSWGEKMTSCHKGEFNLTMEGGKLKLNIYYRNTKILTMPCYKTPYHIAAGVLKAKDPIAVAGIIKDYLDQGLVPGYDFTVTEGGVYLRRERLEEDYDEAYYEYYGLKKPRRKNWSK